MSKLRIAVDVGGTFVDFVLFDPQTGSITIEKVPSSGRLEERFLEGLDRLGVNAADLEMIVHGSTLVINTVVQESGARIGLITTEGFRDVLELGRGNRAEIYNLFYKQPRPLVPRHMRFDVPERMNWQGQVLQPLDVEMARQVVSQLKAQEVKGVAICFLHAYANPDHERRMAEIVAKEFPEAHVSISSDIVREWREYERTSTTVLNAYTKPQMVAYLSSLATGLQDKDYRGLFTVMQSSGGITSSSMAQNAPIRTLQSGPAGGVIGAAVLGATLEQPDLVSADVGGTTFDVAMIVNGRPLDKSTTSVNGRPVLQPTIDIVSIGAGGGSIAWLDDEGGLRIGPRSAEADPGPACYGLGGTEPTVTDAQLLLGYLDPDFYLGHRMVLDRQAAEKAIQAKVADPLGLGLMQAANGMIHLTNMNMVLAIRQVTIERGHDPRQLGLICFGGGGGLFAGTLLQELEMTRAIIPVNPATFSAWGLLNADFREDLDRTTVTPLADVTPAMLSHMLAELDSEARTRLVENRINSDAIVIERFADCRYEGQEHTVKVPVHESDLSGTSLGTLRNRFDQLHEMAYAHASPEHRVELVNLRLSALGIIDKPSLRAQPADGATSRQARKGSRKVFLAGHEEPTDCPVYDRDLLAPGTVLQGPALVEEWTSTTLVLPGQRLEIDRYGNMILLAAT